VKINYPMLWDGHPARSLSLAGKMPAPQNILGYFFNWKSLIQQRQYFYYGHTTGHLTCP